MPASPGGSVVDQSLLRQAADRGVTICFADLDGADGLWVPEERTVLVSRGLSDAKVAEVIEHELAHVMIDDQHADLDAGKDVLVGRPPGRFRRPQTVALAAASLLAVVGGAIYGVTVATGSTKLDRVAPDPNGPGLTAQESGSPPPTVIQTVGPHGETIYITVTPTPATPTASASLTGSPRATPSATPSVPRKTPGRTASAPPAPPQTTSEPPPSVPPTGGPEPTQTSDPPTVAPTTPAVESPGAGGGTGDQDVGDAAPAGTEAAEATDVVPVNNTTVP